MPVVAPENPEYSQFRQLVRRYRRSDILGLTAEVAAELHTRRMNGASLHEYPECIREFALAGVARTALIAANEFRDLRLQRKDLVRLCDVYLHLQDPETMRPDPSVRQLVSKYAYEQYPFQSSIMEPLARSVALFLDGESRVSDSPTDENWSDKLGISLEDFMRLGFALHVATLKHKGRIGRAVLRRPQVQPVFAPHSVDFALAIADRHFVAEPSWHRDCGAEQEKCGYERWSPNPLQARPLVAVDDDLVAPAPQYLVDRISSLGMYFLGIDLFGGKRFPEILGRMFERYVGRQLGLLQRAWVRGEIRYGKAERLSADFFVVTGEVIVIVEAKSARPTANTRAGIEQGEQDLARTIRKAISQIEITAQLVQSRHEDFTQIPTDRPLVGLVVTAEPFYLASTSFFDDYRSRASIPIGIASSLDLENVVATLAARSDVGSRLLAALNVAPGITPNLRTAIDGISPKRNPILEAAWTRWSFVRDGSWGSPPR